MNDTPYWVTLSEASRLLGKTQRTIRRWIKDKKLSEKDTPTGKMVDVSTHVVINPDITATPEDILSLRTQVDKLTTQVDILTKEVHSLTEERDYLRQALAAALGTQRLLAERVTASQGKRPWWRFWQRDEEAKGES